MRDKLRLGKFRRFYGDSRFIEGQLLLESIVAISIAVVGLLGMAALLSRSLSLNRIIANRYVANNLAAEGIEIIKNIVDANIMNGRVFNDGLSANGNYEIDNNSVGPLVVVNCNLDSPNFTGRFLSFGSVSGLYNYDPGASSIFKRCVILENIAGEELKVVSRVKWQDRGGSSFDVVLEDRFLNWRQ